MVSSYAFQIRAQPNAEFRTPDFVSKKLGLKDLGVLLECLLVENFALNGFLDSNPEIFNDLNTSHKKAFGQIGQALYQKYPWHFLFPKSKMSSQITWEQSAGFYDKTRIFLGIEDALSLAQALKSKACVEKAISYGLTKGHIGQPQSSEHLTYVGHPRVGIFMWRNDFYAVAFFKAQKKINLDQFAKDFVKDFLK